jgi:transposase
MKRQYPADLRERLLRAQDAGLSAAEIERTFGISARSLRRWRQWHRERGSLATRPRAGRPPAIPAAQEAALRAQVAAQADATLADHCTRWAQTHGVWVSTATMSRLLRRLGLSLKKNTDRP